jgi:ectoine hydroxylase-related dioxygenase (phytanoyl-CoA dioxygenase family)
VNHLWMPRVDAAAVSSKRQFRNHMNRSDPGYCIFEQVFARTEMEQALAAMASTHLERTRAGARHILGLPVVRELAADPRLVNIARQFVGTGAVPFRATLFDKSGHANWLVVWHQDTALPLRQRTDHPGWGPWSTKAGVLYAHAPAGALEQVVALRVSLDDSRHTNGPLRVLPGTHCKGVLSDSEITQLARITTPVDCLAGSGGVVAMRPLTVHASSKSSDDRPRRVLHIEYAASVNLASGVELAVA